MLLKLNASKTRKKQRESKTLRKPKESRMKPQSVRKMPKKPKE
jgi:hypothetical protein